MLSAFKNYIDFMLDYKNNFNNDWKEYLRFFIGFAIATIVVDFILELNWAAAAIVFVSILLLFDFIWVNILLYCAERNNCSVCGFSMSARTFIRLSPNLSSVPQCN